MATKQGSARIENRKQWQDRIQRAEQRSGSLQAFCKSEGVSRSAIKYWQRKLGAFVPVKIVDSPAIAAATSRRGSSLPDPRWVAEFIAHLVGGSR
jgi:hypothetical protein